MKDGFAEMKKDLIKDIKSASRKKKRREYNSNSSWCVGSGSTRKLENVGSKPKKVKLASYISTGPIDLEQNKPSPLKSKDGVTAIVAVVKAGPKLQPSAKKVKYSNQKLVAKR